jgi:hypothetical protein
MAYNDIQKLIDMGKGFAAQELGPPYNVFRLQSQDENGNTLIASNQIATSFPVLAKLAYGASVRTSFESERQQGVLWYEIIADMTNFLIGDIFVLNDPVYGQGYSSVNFETNQFKGFALADHSPIKKTLGGRLDQCVQIFRLGNGVDSKGRADRTVGSGTPVVLNDGCFSLGTLGSTPAQIPGGLVATGKSYGDRQYDSMPGESRKSGWEVYLPALRGFTVMAGDRIQAADGTRYVVIVPYTQFVGTSGSQWFLERETP